MVVDSYDFLDFYGPENEDQRIVVTSCDDEFYRCPTESTGGTGCCAKPAYPGTAFASGAGAPGIWYVGVYNDKSATATLESYKVSVQIKSTDAKDRDGTCDTCAEGFQWPPGPHDGDQCGLACPGRAPTDVYSNSPALNLFGACSGRGTCKSGNIGNGAYCECDAGAAGAACEVTCPADADGLACSGHGTCRFNDPKNAQNHDDVDDPGRAGSPGATCECEPGRTGAMCEYRRPRRNLLPLRNPTSAVDASTEYLRRGRDAAATRFCGRPPWKHRVTSRPLAGTARCRATTRTRPSRNPLRDA